MALFKKWISKSRGGKEVPLKLEWYMQNLLDGNPCAQQYILDKAKSLNITLLLNVSMRSLHLYVNSGREDDIQQLQSMLPTWIVKKKIPFECQWESRDTIVEAVQTHLRRNKKVHHNKVFVMSESSGLILVGTDDVIESALKLVERYIESLKETMGGSRAVTGSTLEASHVLEIPSGDERDKRPSNEDQSTELNLLDLSDCIVGSDVIAVAFLNQHLSTDLETFLKKESHYEEWKKISSQLLINQHENMNTNIVQPTVGFSTPRNKNRQFAYILIPGGETEVDINTRKSCISKVLQRCVNLQAASVGLVVDVPDDTLKTVGKQIVHTCLDDSHLHITIFCLREQKDILRQLVKDAVYQLGTIDRMMIPNKTKKELKDKASNKHKLQICLQVDEMSRVEADVLVNSVNKNLDISLGGVSKSLNDATNGKLQIALKKAYPNGIREGTFAITDSFGLRSKEIFHGTLKKFGIINNSKSKSKKFELMKGFIHRCLHEVRSNKYKSVAFPVLGCGNLGHPTKDVVHVMFDSVEQFFEEYGQSYVCKVIFVLYPKDKEIIKIFHEEWMARNFEINLKANPETRFSCGKIILRIFCKDIWNSRGESDGLLCFWNEDLYGNPSKHPVVGADLQGIKWDTYASDLEHKRFTTTLGGNLPAKFLYHIRTDGQDVERPLIEALSKASISGCFTLLVPIVDEVSNLSWLDFSKTLWKVLLLTEGNLTVVTLLAKKTGIYKTLLEIMQQLKDGTMQSSHSDILSSAETSNMSSTCQSSKEPSVMAADSDTTGKRASDKLKSEAAPEVENKECTSDEELQDGAGFAKRSLTNDTQIRAANKYPEGENVFHDASTNLKSYPLDQSKALNPPLTKTGLSEYWKTEKISSFEYAAAKHLFDQQEMEKTCRVQEESDGHVIIIFFDTPSAKKVHAKIIAFNCTSVDIPTTKDVPHFLEIVMNDLKNVYTELDQEKKQVHIVSDDWIELNTAKKRIQNKFSTKPSSRQNRFTFSSTKTLSLDSSADRSFSQKSEISNPLDYSLANRSLSQSLNQSNPLDSSPKRSLSQSSDQTNFIASSSANRRLSQRSDQSPPFEYPANSSSSGSSEQSEPPDSPPSDSPQNNTTSNPPGPDFEKDTAVFRIGYLVVKVYIADITKLKIDAIVNAANGQLSHQSGVARAIAEAAGSALEKEGTAYVHKHGPIPASEVVSTTSGNMRCKIVLHAVGPRWRDYTDKIMCLDDLCKCILRCLIETSNRGLTSVAIPVSSSATYGIPKKMCAAIYVRGLKSFNKVIEKTSLKEVHFVDISDGVLAWIRDELNANLGEPLDLTELAKDSAFIQHCLSSRPTHSVGRAPVVKSSSISLQPVVKPSRHSLQLDEAHSSDAQLDSGPGKSDETTFQFNENVSVTVINDNLFKLEANALVSWEERGSTTLSLFQKNLISEGGKIYEDERQKRLQQARKRNIVPTKSGNLIQGQVIHAMVGMTITLEDFLSLVTNLFKRCVSWNYTTVLLPVILNFSSTVKGKKPVNMFMETVVDVLTKLSEEKSRPMLRVIIVDQEDTVVQDLSSALSKYLVSLGLSQNTDKSIRGDKDCPICFDKMTDPERLSCGHAFCKECLKQAFDTKKACPICGRLYGPIIGTTPKGDMRTRKESSSLPGFPGCGTIVITYNIPDGTQTEEHPHPGKHFVGAFWRAYLPDSYEGRKVLALLRVAWRRRLTFTVGQSASLDWDVDRVTWNEILHKTSRTSGNFGYPDETYLQRVQDELEQKGITEKDLETPIH